MIPKCTKCSTVQRLWTKLRHFWRYLLPGTRFVRIALRKKWDKRGQCVSFIKICHKTCLLFVCCFFFLSFLLKKELFWYNTLVLTSREHSLMTALVFWPFLTYLPTYLVLLYNVPFFELSWTPLHTLIWDVINERSRTYFWCKIPLSN